MQRREPQLFFHQIKYFDICMYQVANSSTSWLVSTLFIKCQWPSIKEVGNIEWGGVKNWPKLSTVHGLFGVIYPFLQNSLTCSIFFSFQNSPGDRGFLTSVSQHRIACRMYPVFLFTQNVGIRLLYNCGTPLKRPPQHESSCTS